MAERRTVLTRTRGEWASLVVRTFFLAGGGVGALGVTAHFILGGLGRVVTSTRMPGLGWGAVGTGALALGLATAGCVAVLSRPRLVLARDSAGAGGSAGFGALWVGAPAADDVGAAGDDLGQEVTP